MAVVMQPSNSLSRLQRPAWLDIEDMVLHDEAGEAAFFTPIGCNTFQNFQTTRQSCIAPPPLVLPMLRFSSAFSSCDDDEGGSYCRTDLDYYHCEAKLSALISTGQFTKVASLQSCCNGVGTVELHKRNGSGQCMSFGANDDKVVIKRVPLSRVLANKDKERDERAIHQLGCQRNMEDVLTEIGIYSYLSRQPDRCPYLLKMHSAFEVGNEAWLALQHADGGDLFDVVKNAELSSQQIMHWTWQLLQAVDFLHMHHVGHRDISVENILLHNGDLQLMDFGQAVQTHSVSGIPLRYFCGLGKDYCRAPERKIPKDALVEVVAPRASVPGQIVFVHTKDPENYMCEVSLPSDCHPLQKCHAKPCGYMVPSADVFACGVCVFVMIARMPPWKQTEKSDPHFDFVQNKGIARLLKAWQQQVQPEVVDLLSDMIKSEPAARPSAADCLSRQLFAPS